MTPDGGRRSGEASTQELITRFSDQTSRLIRDELRLAVAELKEKPRHAGIGLGMFSAAGLLAFFGIAALVAAAILALDLVVPAWAAALIVAGGLFVIAAVAGLLGKGQVEQAKPTPERAVENVRQDIEEFKQRGTP